MHTPKLLEILNPYRVKAVNRLASSDYSNEASALGLNGTVIAGNGDLNNGLGGADAPWTGNGTEEQRAIITAPATLSGVTPGTGAGGSSINISPNPFATSTRLNVELMMAGAYEISLADMRGATVAVLAAGHLGEGMHQFVIEKGDLPAGAYVVTVKGERTLLPKVVEIQ